MQVHCAACSAHVMLLSRRPPSLLLLLFLTLPQAILLTGQRNNGSTGFGSKNAEEGRGEGTVGVGSRLGVGHEWWREGGWGGFACFCFSGANS